MATKTKGTEGQPNTARSASINLDENQGRAALAAWRMLFHLYGARVEGWNPTENGVEAIGFSVSAEFDPETIVRDISSRSRRLDFLTVTPWVNGQAPSHYADAGEITADTVQFYKGAVEEGSAKSPPYTKDAIANYKAANALAKKRGPKAKTIRLDQLDELDESILYGMDDKDVAILQAALNRVASSKAASPTNEAAAV
jgi:hypothetical protein